jgi:glycosyltransferase involved in cell wall biosynthesis
MNIWLIQIGESIPIYSGTRKIRTAILSEKLTERGNSVLWWVSAFDHFKKVWTFKKDTELELKKLLKIKALKGIGYQKNISLCRYVDHRIIAMKFRKIAPKMLKPDIIITSMPPHDLAYEAVMFAKRNNIPVLVDIRDPWPDIFLNHIPSKLQKFAKLLLYKDFSIIKKAMQKADGLITMMNSLLEWGLKYAEREKTWRDSVFHLGYKRSLNYNNKTKKFSDIINNLKQKFVVTFIGTFSYYHNPSILVDCAKKLYENNIYFVIAGNGKFFNEIKNKASSLHNVILPGWIDQYEITTLLERSHIGVCPTPYIATFFPNKVFAYLSAGLPVISAFQGELKEIIEKTQIGFYYPPHDVDTLVSSIKRLNKNPELYKKMSENARRVFNEMFDADKIYERYAEHIERIVDDFKKKDDN